MTANDHGKRSTYTTYGCRCDLCRAANRQAQTEYRSRMKAQGYVFRRGLLRRPKQTGDNT